MAVGKELIAATNCPPAHTIAGRAALGQQFASRPRSLCHLAPLAWPGRSRVYWSSPPGAEETALLKACIRCGACLRVCPTHGLQPSLFESGWEGVATPILVPRLGPCEYSCNACGQVCPTGAIPFLLLDRKQQQPIGKAYIDRSLCIAWSGRGPCIVCEEMCPLPHKAIKLEEMAIEKEKGLEIALQVPVVNHNLCIGCGLCENKCPVQGEAAIRVRIDPLA